MKVNTKQTYVDLKNRPMVDEEGETVTLGIVLANIVVAPNKNKDGFKPIKAWELAQRFTNLDEVELDNSDFIQLQSIVEKNEFFAPTVTAQTLIMLRTIELEHEKGANV